MNVTLLTHTPEPEKIVAAAARLCYSSSEISEIMDNFTDEKEKAINIITADSKIFTIIFTAEIFTSKNMYSEENPARTAAIIILEFLYFLLAIVPVKNKRI